MRVMINGFGRIGRTILRILTTGPRGAEFEVVAINDIEPLETCAYLFQYDSVFGPLPLPVSSACRTWYSRSFRARNRSVSRAFSAAPREVSA